MAAAGIHDFRAVLFRHGHDGLLEALDKKRFHLLPGAVACEQADDGGQGAQAFPDGFTPRPAPFGVSFTASACGEPTLVGIAYAFEQATKKRVRPPLFP